MTDQEIKEGIGLVCRTSQEIHNYYKDNNALIAKLNSVPKDELDQVAAYYEDRSGVIVDLRKEVLSYLRSGKKLDPGVLNGYVLKHRTGKESQYRAYKTYYSIFFPFITFYGHNHIREFIKSFIDELVKRLDLEGKVKTVYFDFQGARQQGSDRMWLAIYNGQQESQSAALQIFFDFFEGRFQYGIYSHNDAKLKKDLVDATPDNFNLDDCITLFSENKHLILNDTPTNDKPLTIPLLGKSIYKISHGSFKTKENASIRDVFKDNQWIVLHENTGKGQADVFKNEVTEGDYVYITVGGNELFAVARIKPGSWGYVPEDITDVNGWIYREVEYIKMATRPDTSDLKSYKEFIYPSGNSTLTEIPIDKIDEANNRIFGPHFGIQFIANTAVVKTAQGDVRVFPRNVILYGPPGTGKTFNTIDRAVEIVLGTRGNHEENKISFDRLRKEGQIDFLTFHQNYSYEDFMICIRPDLDEASTLKFRRVEGIFYRLCKRAEQNFLQANTRTELLKPFQEVFTEFIAPLKEDEKEIEIRMISGKASYWITDINSSSISFRKQSGGTGHTLSIDTLKELYLGTRDFTGGLEYYYTPLVNLLLKKGKQGQQNVEPQNFVLIIDEINRANISRVFGELITLLEDDKRIGQKNELRITLPNGEKEFGIPPNVYIIGTMNTADRSIALIDIALRRRFEFIGCFPEYSKLVESDGDLLRHINKEVYRQKKSADCLVGHAYFMGESDPIVVLQNKVIPLLMEYFSGKTGLVEGIFKDSGWTVHYDETKYQWLISPQVNENAI
jgi:5-methylcytosine-specific restriction protein B